jgi:hypothetical protein
MKNFSTVPGIGTPSTNRPYGPFGDDSTPGDGTGTAVRTDWVGDVAYAWIKLMNDSGLVPDNSEEGVTTGQALLAVQNSIHNYAMSKSALHPKANLRVYPAAAHPTYQCTITYDELYIGWKKATSGSHTVDIQVNGAGGLDTGSEANVWYYIYMIMKQDGTLNTLLSASPTSPTLPSGYIYSRMIGAVHNTAGNFVAFQQKNRNINITFTKILSDGASATYAAIDLTVFIPHVIVDKIIGKTVQEADGVAISLSPDGVLDYAYNFGAGLTNLEIFYTLFIITNNIYYKVSTGSTSDIYLSGYELYI